MSATPSPTQSEPTIGSLRVKKSLVEVLTIDPAKLKNDQLESERPWLGKRVPLGIAVITFCIGVAATLAWQSYGDAATEMIANSFPRLSWLAPRAAPIAHSTPDTLATPATPPPDLQQLNAVSLDLDAVRQSVERIAASQEQLTRSVDQLTAGQERVTREIAKLQAGEQQNLSKKSEPQPQSVPARRLTPRPSQAPTAR
jgi:hypothetical protein